MSFDLHPPLAMGEEDRFRQYEETVSSSLYPLGEASGGHVFLAVAEDGRVFAIMDNLWHVADSIDEALESLVLGRNWRRII